MPPLLHVRRALTLIASACTVLLVLGWSQSSAASHPTSVFQTSSSLIGSKTFPLPGKATHIALHWRGQPGARLRVAFSRDGRHFGRARLVQLDELGEQLRTGETFGAMMAAPGTRAVRVSSNRPLTRLTVLALTDRGSRVQPPPRLVRTLADVAQPAVIPRAGWSADESLRFDSTGKEIWPPAFYPIQKLIVHHTATTNNDPDPAATIRSIYYYHAITQGWGDIGYNFLLDEAGNIYEGRYSRQYAPGESPTGQDLNGNGVTAAHAQGYNSGTVGIALLGTLTTRDATPAARGALERLLARIAGTHGIDPQGSSLYTNPVSGLQATFANIAGHRDVAATECPGGTFYATLPTIRSDVTSLIASTAPDFALAVSPSSASVDPGGSASYSVSVSATNGFSGSVALTVAGLPSGASATITPITVSAPGSSQLVVSTSTSTSTPAGSYPLTISGTSGLITHTTSATLVVNPPPDFSLAISPSSRSIKRGSSTSYSVSVSRQGSFSGSVSLSVSGQPNGASASFTPTSVVAPGSATLKITTSSSAPRGSFVLTVTGTGATTIHSVTATLTLR